MNNNCFSVVGYVNAHARRLVVSHSWRRVRRSRDLDAHEVSRHMSKILRAQLSYNLLMAINLAPLPPLNCMFWGLPDSVHTNNHMVYI